MKERLHGYIPRDLKPPRFVEGLKSRLPELAASTAIGAGLRTAANYGLAACGISGLGLSVAAGAIAGAGISAGRESWNQYKHEGGIHDKKRVLVSALKGGAVGAVGALIGWELANLLIDPCIDIPNNPEQIPGPEETQGGGGPGSGAAPPGESGPAPIPETTPPAIPDQLTPEEAGSGQQFSCLPSAEPLPDIVALKEGSSLWDETFARLEQELCRPPTNEEVLIVAKEAAIDSDIQVGEWGIFGSHLDTKLLPGHPLVFTDAKKALGSLALK